jgi:hypothetical protein
MMSDAAARAILVSQWPRRKLVEYQIVGAIGRFEGNYGAAFKNAQGEPANNWGASSSVVAVRGVCPIGTTGTLDHKRDGTPYTACITRFPTPEAGARSLIRALTAPRRPEVARAMLTGSALDVARAMSRSGYMAQRAAKYAVNILRNASSIARALGEPLQVHAGSSRASAGSEFLYLAAILEFGLFLALRGAR